MLNHTQKGTKQMTYFERIKSAKSNDELVLIENDIRADKELDVQEQEDYVGFIADRQMNDFGKLLNM